MMERRRALTIPFVDQENMMENPLKIPAACLSSECGKLEAQVSWTAFADCKYKTRNSSHKNGSKMFGCNYSALKSSEMLRRKPRLILTDVLKTELGKDYIARIKMSSNIRWLSSPRKDDGRRKEEGLPCKDTRSSQSSERNKSRNVTPKGKQRTPTPQRPATRNRKSQNPEELNQDIKEVIIGKDKEDEKEEKFDCGLSLRSKPAWTTSAISVGFTKNNLTGSEDDAQSSSKRKRKDPGLQCNGTSSPKRQRESVLCQTGEAGKDTEQLLMTVSQEETDEDGDLESLDRCIVQFTVGGEDGLEPLIPVIPHVEPEGIIFSSKLSLSPLTQTSPSDPIVLSSDDEESSDDPKFHRKLVQRVASVVDAVVYRSSSKEAVSQQAAEVQMLQLLVEETPPSAPASPLPEVDYSSLSIPFSSMYCGCYKVRANGGLMIAKHKIIIPLKGTSEHLAFERKELRRYSVWDQQELEDQEIHFDGDEDPSPPGVLLFHVTDAAAAAIQQELYQLCLSEDGPIDTGKASPFILLTLKDPLEGMEGALLRSVLDIDCINRMTHEHSIANSDKVGLNSLFYSDSPVLTLDESIKLIRRIGVDSHLLSILGMKCSDSDLSVDRVSSHYEEEIPTAHIWVDTSFERDVELDLEMAAEDGETEAAEDEETEVAVEDEEMEAAVEDGETEAAAAEDEEMQAAAGDGETEAAAGDGETEAAAGDGETEAAAGDGETEAAAGDGETEAAAGDGETEAGAGDGETEAGAGDGETEAGAEDGETEAGAEDGETEAAGEDGETEVEPKKDQEDEEPETSSDSKKEEARPLYIVCHHRRKGSYSVSLCNPDSKWSKYKYQGLTQRLIQFPPPPLKGGITVTMEDLQCLDSGEYLNDVIIDFYLKYLVQNASSAISERSHIFSSFFYKQLTRRDNASEGGNSESCQRQRRHQRVKTWTRHVDIFNKDFLFVPVNQEAHWYLVVICFPGLDEPQLDDWVGESQGQDEGQECKSSNDHIETLVRLDPSDSMDTETENSLDEASKHPPPPCPVSCTEKTCLRRTVCRRPCILIMDSLKLSSHERICKLLREYLQSEWEVRRGSSRDFGLDQMKSSHCQVPLQDNSSDCGLYLLQYVECFLKDPVVHFDLPLQLQKWFSRQVVRKKRDEIRNLILNLYRNQNLDSKNT